MDWQLSSSVSGLACQLVTLRSMLTCTTWLQGKLWTDAGFWGAVSPLNANSSAELQGMLHAGALGFKSFLSPSGMHAVKPWPYCALPAVLSSAATECNASATDAQLCSLLESAGHAAEVCQGHRMPHACVCGPQGATLSTSLWSSSGRPCPT